jgi:DNA-binding NarL/FixJ family response regulator
MRRAELAFHGQINDIIVRAMTEIRGVLLSWVPKIIERELMPQLSPRQQAIADLILAGKSNKEIGNELNIAERTVKFHASAIFRAFGVQDRKELFAKRCD